MVYTSLLKKLISVRGFGIHPRDLSFRTVDSLCALVVEIVSPQPVTVAGLYSCLSPVGYGV